MDPTRALLLSPGLAVGASGRGAKIHRTGFGSVLWGGQSGGALSSFLLKTLISRSILACKPLIYDHYTDSKPKLVVRDDGDVVYCTEVTLPTASVYVLLDFQDIKNSSSKVKKIFPDDRGIYHYQNEKHVYGSKTMKLSVV